MPTRTMTPTPSHTPTVTPDGVGIYDDTSPQFSYSGNWNTYSGSGPYNNTMHYSSAANATATFSFYGTRFVFTYTAAPNAGNIDIYVDGNKETTLNQYKSSTQYQKTWNSPTYSDGLHTVQFINHYTSGKSGNVDAVTVYTTNPTNTHTQTPTSSNTPTDTSTPSRTPTRTATPTPSNTPTKTPTRTPTNTPTDTPTPTETPTALPPIPEGETWKYYYFAGAQRVAVRSVSSVTSSLNYLLSDHLGSTSITVSPSGEKVAEMRYYAFGNTRYTQGDTPTDYQYTGQRFESGIGLYYYNARWYDPVLGRFAQADTVVPGGVQGYDRYAYVNNNPMNATDPTGHDCRWVDMSGHMVWFCDPPTGGNGGEGIKDDPLPTVNPEDVQNPEGASENVVNKTIAVYNQIRDVLLSQCGYECIDRATGKIKDQYLVALIMVAEFGLYKKMGITDVYYEGLEAVSNQYYSGKDLGYTKVGAAICEGDCTMEEQITWLLDIQAVRGPGFVEKQVSSGAYKEYLEDAEKAVSEGGFTYGVDSSWNWGNVTDDNLSNYVVTAKTNIQFYYPEGWFIVYSALY